MNKQYFITIFTYSMVSRFCKDGYLKRLNQGSYKKLV